jgi:hypothetical protein
LPASPATVFWVLLRAFFCFHGVVLQSVEERGTFVQDVRLATKRELLLRWGFEGVEAIELFRDKRTCSCNGKYVSLSPFPLRRPGGFYLSGFFNKLLASNLNVQYSVPREAQSGRIYLYKAGVGRADQEQALGSVRAST